MDIPLPSVISNVAPGGPLVTSMQGRNALIQSAAEAKYAEQKAYADAASKIAYANLMGPQFLAKLMGNPDLVATSPQLQDPSTTNKLYQAGMGGGTGNAMLGSPMMGPVPQVQSTSPFEKIVNAVKSAFNIGAPSNPLAAPQTGGQPANALYNQSGEPSDMPVDQVNQGKGTAPTPTNASSYDKNGRNIVGTPDDINAAANGHKKTYAEKVADFRNVTKEGEELGTARGKAIDELGKQYAQDVEGMAPLNRLMEISQSPTFMNMRNSIPGFQELQLNTLKNFTGTPEQKRMIGDYIASSKSVIGNTVRDFQGRAMAKEFDFANQLKIGDNDNIDVILGKLESLTAFKNSTMRRNEIARKLMGAPNHMNEGDAYEAANKQVDMKAIREEISNNLKSPVRVKNQKTGEVKYISPKEYNDLLNKK